MEPNEGGIVEERQQRQRGYQARQYRSCGTPGGGRAAVWHHAGTQPSRRGECRACRGASYGGILETQCSALKAMRWVA